MMVQLVLSDEQAKLLCQADGTVHVVDRAGRDLGHLIPASCKITSSDQDVALAIDRMSAAKSGGVFLTTQEVLQHITAAERS